MKLSVAILRIDALGVIGAMALSAGAAAVVVGPLLVAPGPSHNQQLQEIEDRKREAADLQRQADAARRRLAELNSESAVAVHLFPPEQINQRLVVTTTLADSCGVSLTQMLPAAPAPGGPDARSLVVPIKLAGTGSYPGVASFLHALHDRFRDTAITALHMNAPAGDHTASIAGAADNAAGSFSIDLAWHAALAASNDAPAKP